MFLRGTIRKKNGKEHRYWSIVENKRIDGGKVHQRHVLYLGEINASQERAWRKSIEVLDEQADRPRTLALFPEDRCEGLLPDSSIVQLRLSQLRLCRPRQWGACWLALKLWEELELGEFWGGRLTPSRKGTRWDHVNLKAISPFGPSITRERSASRRTSSSRFSLIAYMPRFAVVCRRWHPGSHLVPCSTNLLACR